MQIQTKKKKEKEKKRKKSTEHVTPSPVILSQMTEFHVMKILRRNELSFI